MKRKHYDNYDYEEAYQKQIDTLTEWELEQMIKGKQINSLYRTTTTKAGDQLEADIYPSFGNKQDEPRTKKKRESRPSQKNLNDKNARRYLVQLGNGNFGIGDLHVTCTYAKGTLPETEEEAERVVGNYLRRIAYRRKKLKLPPLKYILVTEYGYSKDGDKITRIHHHIIMNGGMSRDEVEMMWTAERINWHKYDTDPEYMDQVGKLGWVNADRLQVDKTA